MTTQLIWITTVISGLLIGCAPLYRPHHANKTVSIDVSTLKSPEVCQDHRWYRLKKNYHGYARIGHGHRIIIANHFEEKIPNAPTSVIQSCRPQLSFFPTANSRYQAIFSKNKNECHLDLLRQAKNGKYYPDRTMQTAHCD